MSYTTRRSGGIPGNQQTNSVGNIGQRRPVVTNNFVPSGTVTPHGQAKNIQNQQPRQAQPGQNNPTIHFRNQQQHQPQVKIETQHNRQQQYQTSQQGQQKLVPQSQQRPPQPQTVEKHDVVQAQQPPQQFSNPPQCQQPQQQFPIQPQGQQPQQQFPIQPQGQQHSPQLQKHDDIKPQPEQKVSQPDPENQEQSVKPEQSSAESDTGEPIDTSANQQTHPPRRRPWFRRNLPRREMIRRRNFKLSKILKPKNAVAILNELVKNVSYEVENISNRSDGRTFKASIQYDDVVHEGFGFTEDQAKNGAAEVVLKHYIKSNKIGESKKNEDGLEQMELGQEDENAHVPLPWQHVASFAIYKLFSQWEEDPSLVGISASYLNVKQDIKSSKKMPPNPETINPLMLLNQMIPNAKFEEIGRSGNPPQIMFSFRCTIDDQFFIGSGTNKRVAKRAAAFEACHKVLGITYPPEIFVPSESSVKQL